ncbi:MAG: hypothetical protein PHW09_07440 [Desulfovibrio desulfuricans]|nr:hypothetical protein [Desulfovibrio desulfuricans]
MNKAIAPLPLLCGAAALTGAAIYGNPQLPARVRQNSLAAWDKPEQYLGQAKAKSGPKLAQTFRLNVDTNLFFFSHYSRNEQCALFNYA